jgi:hypothetical protein
MTTTYTYHTHESLTLEQLIVIGRGLQARKQMNMDCLKAATSEKRRQHYRECLAKINEEIARHEATPAIAELRASLEARYRQVVQDAADASRILTQAGIQSQDAFGANIIINTIANAYRHLHMSASEDLMAIISEAHQAGLDTTRFAE